MKWLINGIETELEPGASGAQVTKLPDRLSVRTASGQKTALVARIGGKVVISYSGHLFEVEKASGVTRSGGAVATGQFSAPMPGLIIDVLVGPGDRVVKGQKLLVLEAMKTQQPVNAPFDGRIEHLNVEKGQQVREGDLMISVTPNEP